MTAQVVAAMEVRNWIKKPSDNCAVIRYAETVGLGSPERREQHEYGAAVVVLHKGKGK